MTRPTSSVHSSLTSRCSTRYSSNRPPCSRCRSSIRIIFSGQRSGSDVACSSTLDARSGSGGKGGSGRSEEGGGGGWVGGIDEARRGSEGKGSRDGGVEGGVEGASARSRAHFRISPRRTKEEKGKRGRRETHSSPVKSPNMLTSPPCSIICGCCCPYRPLPVLLKPGATPPNNAGSSLPFPFAPAPPPPPIPNNPPPPFRPFETGTSGVKRPPEETAPFEWWWAVLTAAVCEGPSGGG